MPFLTTEICYNGIDNNGDGAIDDADPLCKIIRVTTTADVLDGDVSSVDNLLNNPGIDGAISLREAITATQAPASGFIFYTIGFNFPNYDAGHFYYQDDNIPNQVTEANRVSTTSIDDSTLGDKDVDYPRSWFQLTINSALPPLCDNVLIDGYDLRQTQMNENELGKTLNTAIRLEIVAAGDFPIFTINEAKSEANQVIIRGLSLNGRQEMIQINESSNGMVWLYGNYFGLTPTALAQKNTQKSLIDIQHTNRSVIIGSNADGTNDEGETNLFAGTINGQSAIFSTNATQLQVNQNYFGVGLKTINKLNGSEGTAIKSIGGQDNKFSHNIISFYETGFDLYESDGDTIAENAIGVYAESNNDLIISNEGGISNRCQDLVITKNTIANSQKGWHFLATKNSQFTKNEVYQQLTVGLNIVNEANDPTQKNENNFVYQNKIHHNLIGILIGQNATDNMLLQNSIYANASIGIDISAAGINADGITLNDLNDTDSGPQQFLNFPILTVTNYTNTTATVAVSLDIDDSYEDQEGYRIEFFANSSSMDRGGEIYLGYLDVGGDVNNAAITLPLPESVLASYHISATTSIIKIAVFTNLVPALAFAATSEFSASVPLPPAEICGNNMDDDGDGLVDCDDPDCANFLEAGTIQGAEATCFQSFLPTIIHNVSTPTSDPRITAFYQWEQSTDNGETWEEINRATAVSYFPPIITQTTLYRRLVRKNECNDWVASNTIEKKIKPIPVANIMTIPAENGGDLCANVPYVFAAENAGAFANYTWNFGRYATPSTSTRQAPTAITYTTPNANTDTLQSIILEVELDGCTNSDTTTHNIHPLLQIQNVSVTQPTSCGGTDGSILLSISGEADQCIAVSIDGGNTYLPDNQFTINNLAAGAYPLFVRYCALDCAIDGGIINLSDPAAIRANDDEIIGSCPGVLFQGNVANNDTLGDNPVFSLAADATYGRITLAQTGQFIYTPISNACGADQFSYKVCNGNTGCCATATVNVTFGDDTPPTFGDLPLDLTIGWADEIPAKATVQAFDNCPTTDLFYEENSTQNNTTCGQYDYLITRTWIATDQCGNSTNHVQTISVVDETTPDIFRIHTLPNGKKMVAGVIEFTSEHWKTVYLPINFAENPIVFTQLLTNNEATAATVRLRNVTENQFEIRLQEAATDDGIHLKESVAWMAMETGEQTANYHWQADTIPLTHSWTTIPFTQRFDNIPLLFANMQTTRDADAATVRNTSVNWTNGRLRLQEENSEGINTAHASETVAYLAIADTGNLSNQTGGIIGETGRVKTTSDWFTITLDNTYNNPVIIANSLSIDDFDPATVRIQNVTNNSFEVRVEEWSYLDGEHRTETIGYLVIEGSLPLETPTDFCDANSIQLDFSDELIALDNTGQFLPITYDERISFTGTEQIIHRDWSATDVCGNIGVATQTIACPGIALKAKTMLHGALIGSNDSNLMRDDLRKANLIPLVEPYTDLNGFEHVGASGGEMLREDLLTIEGADAIVDWVLLELRSRLDKSHVVASAVGLVQRDGDIISNRGDSLIVFPSAVPSSYYVAVRHRNHICMLSNSTQTFTNDNVPNLDFTNPTTTSTDAGTTTDATLAMWAGDLNQDNQIIFQGPNNDIFYLFLTILLDPENTNAISNFVSHTYSAADFNLDGRVLFQGPNNDRSALLFNTILLHPDNTAYFSNFILHITGKGGN